MSSCARLLACLAAFSAACGNQSTSAPAPVDRNADPVPSPQPPSSGPPSVIEPPAAEPPASSQKFRLTLEFNAERPGASLGGSGTGPYFYVEPGGLFCPSDCTLEFPAGSKVRVVYENYVLRGVPDERFERWTGACEGTDLSCAVTMDADKTVVADLSYHRHVLLAISIVGPGDGQLSADRADDPPYYGYDRLRVEGLWADFALEIGESVTLSPAPDPGSHLGAWIGACSPAGRGACTFKATEGMPSLVTTSARFDR